MWAIPPGNTIGSHRWLHPALSLLQNSVTANTALHYLASSTPAAKTTTFSNNLVGTITINSGGTGTTCWIQRGFLSRVVAFQNTTVNNNVIGGTAPAGSISR